MQLGNGYLRKAKKGTDLFSPAICRHYLRQVLDAARQWLLEESEEDAHGSENALPRA